MIGNENRAGVHTAPAGQGRRRRSDQPYSNMLEDDTEEKPLALMNGGFKDDLNESQPTMKAVLPPPAGHMNNRPPRTAGTKHRPNKRQGNNSLGLHAPSSKDSQTRLQTANNQQQNLLLGRIE